MRYKYCKKWRFWAFGKSMCSDTCGFKHTCKSAINFSLCIVENVESVLLKTDMENMSFCLADSEWSSSEAQWKAVTVLSYLFCAICSFTQLKWWLYKTIQSSLQDCLNCVRGFWQVFVVTVELRTWLCISCCFCHFFARNFQSDWSIFTSEMSIVKPWLLQAVHEVLSNSKWVLWNWW